MRNELEALTALLGERVLAGMTRLTPVGPFLNYHDALRKCFLGVVGITRTIVREKTGCHRSLDPLCLISNKQNSMFQLGIGQTSNFSRLSS